MEKEELMLILAIIIPIIAILLWAFIFNKNAVRKKRLLLEDATKEADMIKQSRILEAKEKFIQMKSDLEKRNQEQNKRFIILKIS